MKTVISNKILKTFIASLPTPYCNMICEETTGGISTNVYRLKDKKQVYYLRILPKERFASAQIISHKLLLKNGVIVPKVLYYENINSILGKSFMIVSEIKGQPLENESNANIRNIVLEKAGEQLAKAHKIEVDGVGWINDRKETAKLEALGNNYYDFWFGSIDNDLDELLRAKLLNTDEVNAIQKVFADNSDLIGVKNRGYLAHGDFDPTHIYYADGKYLGIIDWGDIRSTSIYHDLGHFDIFSGGDLDYLLKGYQKITKLPSDFWKRIILEGFLISVGKLWWNHANGFTGRRSSIKSGQYIRKHLNSFV